MRESTGTAREEQPLTVIVAARLYVRQWGRLKYMCARANLSMSDAIRRAIDYGTNESMTDENTEKLIAKKTEELSMKRKNKKGQVNVQS